MTAACRKQLDGLDLRKASNAGLTLSSYLESHDESDKTSRIELLDAAISACQQAKGVYELAFLRWGETLSVSSVSDTAEVLGRAVIGLGSESPLETGLTLHHTYGTPIIPGSALKGLASHYCAKIWGAREGQSTWARGGESHRVMFGDTEDAGHVIFYDSWILPEYLTNCLETDVMTVHHPDYYQKDPPVAPSDYDDPTPISFLSIRGKFRLFVQCDVLSDEGKSWAKVAIKLLREAMENWGFGGKTAAGYGRIVPTQGGVSAGHAHQTPGPKVAVKQGETVQAVLIDEKTKAGGWKAACGPEAAQTVGHILNTADVPLNCTAGDSVTLIVHSVSRTAIVFRWPKRK